jgi:hypothetical protein
MPDKPDLVLASLDRASRQGAIGLVHLRRGRLERSAIAFRQAQRYLAEAELELLERLRIATLKAIAKRRRAA